MINSYPPWKYFCVFLIFIVGCIYALPSLYKEDYIVTIINDIFSHQKNNDTLLFDVNKILENRKIVNKSIIFTKNQAQVYFFSETDQLRAYEILECDLSKTYSIFCSKKSSMPNWLNLIQARPIKLGSDLKGGLYFIIKVDIATVLNKFQEQHMDTVRSILTERVIPYIKIFSMNNYEIEIDFQDVMYRNQALLCLSKEYNNFLILKSVLNNKLHIVFPKSYIFSVCEDVMKKNFVILKHRMNQLNISNSIIQRYGDDCIIIELPGIEDMNKIKTALSNTASIELRLVNTHINKIAINNNFIPEDSEIKLDNNGHIVPIYKKIILTGDHIINANVDFDEYHRPQVNVFLDSIGSSILSEATRNNIGKLIATLFIEYKNIGKKNTAGYPILYKHEKVINIATIQSQLTHNFCISGINNLSEARNLSSLLRMGSLAAPIYIEEEYVVEPTLGQKNVTQGIIACVLGVLISICFMVIWYRCFGLIAAAALIMNLILIISIMSLIPDFMLTMPSIAGIVLTLSVAIDANVLINERIKEEIKKGKPIQYSIYMGYKKAFITIVDANITTFITGIVLYIMSTGPIQGFAMTIIIGIGTSMFTSIIGTRVFVNLFYGNRSIDTLSI